MAGLAHATRIIDVDGAATAEIDPAWSIWGPIGGYVAAIALRGAGRIAPPGHRPVTFSCQFLSRANPAAVQVEAVTIKAGSTACHNVTLTQDGRAFLQAQVWTTSKNAGPSRSDLTMPDVPAANTLESFADQMSRLGRELAGFWTLIDGRQVDFRPTGDADPRGCRTERWLRIIEWHATPDPFLEAARALIGIDAHIWPAHIRGLDALPSYVAPSLDLTVWFHTAAPEAEWQLVEARSEVSGEGLMAGTARLWSSDGVLVASGGSQCLIVPIKPGG